MWYRVFCRSADVPDPQRILARLREDGVKVDASFTPDGRGWTTGEMRLGPGTPVLVERYETAEDDLRNDLNTWAGYLETLDYSPDHVPLMERVIQTQQLFTVRKPLDHANESAVEDLCRALCLHLAG